MEIIGRPDIIRSLEEFKSRNTEINLISKDELICALKLVCQLDWVESIRPGNDGAVGNTIEDLLGIPENNLPIPNAAEWELKGQRLGTTSLVSMFHLEPSPRSAKLVTRLLLPKYGWIHRQAGQRYPITEMSFRQTINGLNRTDRGFGIVVDHKMKRIAVSFDANCVDIRHKEWKREVSMRVGLGELEPQPYWGFDDLFHKTGTKLHNCFFLLAKSKRFGKKEFFKYTSVKMLEQLSLEKFVHGVENGLIYVDFDARTGHNHGTKFRIRRDRLPELYQKVTEIV